METNFRYIRFIELQRKEKTSVYGCLNIKSGGELGRVKWYPAWRQYCYFPTARAVYSSGCLADIAEFIDQLMGQEGKHETGGR
jgi:hypothetical protein